MSKCPSLDRENEIKCFWLFVLFSQQILVAFATQTNCMVQSENRSLEAGNASAMYDLAESYANGRGVTQDVAQAVLWYRKAAEAGDSRAMSIIGRCYQEGCCVTQDVAQAVQWYRKGAEAGALDAMINLAICYANGTGVVKNEENAYNWYYKAAQIGDDGAIKIVAEYSRRGIGLGKNETKFKETDSRLAQGIQSNAIVSVVDKAEPSVSSLENDIVVRNATASKKVQMTNDALINSIVIGGALVCVLAGLAIIIVAKINADPGPEALSEELKRRTSHFGRCLSCLALAALFCFPLFLKIDEAIRLSTKGKSTIGILSEAFSHISRSRKGRISTKTYRTIIFDSHCEKTPDKPHYTSGTSVNVVYVPDKPSVFRVAKADTTFWQFLNMDRSASDIFFFIMTSFMLLGACVGFWEFVKRTPSESEKESERLKEENARQKAEMSRKQAEERKQRKREEENEQKRKLQIKKQEGREEGEKLYRGILAFERGKRYSVAKRHTEKRHTEAVECFTEAIDCGVPGADVFAMRGTCLHNLNRQHEAIKDFSKAIELDPSNCNNYYMRAMAKNMVGDYIGFEDDMHLAINFARLSTPLNDVYKLGALQQGFSSVEALYKDTLRMIRSTIDTKTSTVIQCAKYRRDTGLPLTLEEYDKIKKKEEEDKERIMASRSWLP